jgi:hypothetical protein
MNGNEEIWESEIEPEKHTAINEIAAKRRNSIIPPEWLSECGFSPKEAKNDHMWRIFFSNFSSFDASNL